MALGNLLQTLAEGMRQQPPEQSAWQQYHPAEGMTAKQQFARGMMGSARDYAPVAQQALQNFPTPEQMLEKVDVLGVGPFLDAITGDNAAQDAWIQQNFPDIGQPDNSPAMQQQYTQEFMLRLLDVLRAGQNNEVLNAIMQGPKGQWQRIRALPENSPHNSFDAFYSHYMDHLASQGQRNYEMPENHWEQWRDQYREQNKQKYRDQELQENQESGYSEHRYRDPFKLSGGMRLHADRNKANKAANKKRSAPLRKPARSSSNVVRRQKSKGKK